MYPQQQPPYQQPSRPPRKRVSPLLIVLASVGGVLGLCLCVGTIGALVAGDPDATDPSTAASARSAPRVDYHVVSQKDGNITVEVDTLPTKEQMNVIVTELRDKQTEETGYFVLFNCSTGGTATADNRLGNGRFGIGALGKARTGLDEGVIDIQVNEDRTCPATSTPEESRAAYLVETDDPKRQAAYQAVLDKIHPTLGTHTDKSLFNDGQNTCGDIAKGEDSATVLSRVKKRYQRDDVTVDDALAQRILTEAIPALCPAIAG